MDGVLTIAEETVNRLVVDMNECLLADSDEIDSILKAILIVESVKQVEGARLQAFVDNVCGRTFLKDDVIESLNVLMTQRGICKPAATQQKIVINSYDPFADDEYDMTASLLHADYKFEYEKHWPEDKLPIMPPKVVHFNHRPSFPAQETCLTRSAEGHIEFSKHINLNPVRLQLRPRDRRRMWMPELLELSDEEKFLDFWLK